MSKSKPMPQRKRIALAAKAALTLALAGLPMIYAVDAVCNAYAVTQIDVLEAVCSL